MPSELNSKHRPIHTDEHFKRCWTGADSSDESAPDLPDQATYDDSGVWINEFAGRTCKEQQSLTELQWERWLGRCTITGRR
jgi:hypothetical protein